MGATSATLTTMMALAAWFLGISVFVQVVQELYKQLSSSKSRTYSSTLLDFFGPAAQQLLDAGTTSRVMIRGPFQFLRLQPKGRLLPLEKETLLGALERAAPPWHRLTQSALETEAKLQNGAAQPASATFMEYLRNLAHGVEEQPGRFDAEEMSGFLKERGIMLPRSEQPVSTVVGDGAGIMDAQKILIEFRRKYSQEAVRAEEHFCQLMQNYEYSYGRRNLRQTFVIALLLALWCDFAFDTIYKSAANATAQEARSAAQTAIDMYQKLNAPAQQNTSPDVKAVTARDSALKNNNASAANTNQANGSVDTPDTREPSARPQPTPSSAERSDAEPKQRVAISYVPNKRLLDIITLSHPNQTRFQFIESGVSYLFGCMLTAILVCFGAPFWNGLTKSLLRVSQSNDPTQPKPKKT
jgi:hypothetical protein